MSDHRTPVAHPYPPTEADRVADEALARTVAANVDRMMNRMRSPDARFGARRAALRRTDDELAEWFEDGRPF